MEALVTPPFRTRLLSGSDTSRDWWLFWNQLSVQTNSNAKLAVEGTHDDRPEPEDMPGGAIYIESDRGVIYQQQGGSWVYVAGMMYGTLAPDQRPDDLAEFDGGFPFRASDTDPANRGRDFVWSGTGWVEITPVRYGTHANRPAPAVAPARALYIEIDRSSVLYQSQASGIWEFVAGTMWGTLVPDQRPTDLGTHDAGFTFRTTVNPPRQFIWSGTAWVETTPALTAYFAYGSGSAAITVAGATIPGASVTVVQAGQFLIRAGFYAQQAGAGDAGQFLQGVLLVNGLPQTPTADSSLAPGEAVISTQQWFLTLAAGATLSLQMKKTGGTGSSTAYGANSSISALFISP
jgi:hypothetical protein